MASEGCADMETPGVGYAWIQYIYMDRGFIMIADMAR